MQAGAAQVISVAGQPGLSPGCGPKSAQQPPAHQDALQLGRSYMHSSLPKALCHMLAGHRQAKAALLTMRIFEYVQGGWREDLKHGLGRKIYANGDVYEGLWCNGKPDGPGRCVAPAGEAGTVQPLYRGLGGWPPLGCLGT